jgi:hypothetical protein
MTPRSNFEEPSLRWIRDEKIFSMYLIRVDSTREDRLISRKEARPRPRAGNEAELLLRVDHGVPAYVT